MKTIPKFIWGLQVRLAYFVEDTAMYLVKLSYQILNYRVDKKARFYEGWICDSFSQKLENYLNETYPNKKQEK